jgi:hypothetical protein
VNETKQIMHSHIGESGFMEVVELEENIVYH